MKPLAVLLCCLVGEGSLIAQPAPIVRSIRFVNLEPVSVEDILARWKERGARLRLEQPYDRKDVAEAAHLLRELLTERGCTDVEIRTSTEPVPPRSIGVIFTGALKKGHTDQP